MTVVGVTVQRVVRVRQALLCRGVVYAEMLKLDLALADFSAVIALKPRRQVLTQLGFDSWSAALARLCGICVLRSASGR